MSDENQLPPRNLVQYGSIVQPNYKLRFPLHYAAEHGQAETIRVLLEQMTDGDIIQTDFDGNCALHLAASRGHVRIIQYLLERVPAEQLQMTDKEGRTALHHAIHGNDGSFHVPVFKVLFEKRTPKTLTIKENRGKTALHYANSSTKSDESMIRWIIVAMKPGDIAIQDENGKTALHYAAISAAETRTATLLRYMNRDGMMIQDNDGNTALHYAIISVHSTVTALENINLAGIRFHEDIWREVFQYAAAGNAERCERIVDILIELHASPCKFSKDLREHNLKLDEAVDNFPEIKDLVQTMYIHALSFKRFTNGYPIPERFCAANERYFDPMLSVACSHPY
jgi:hypothetical protein